VSADEDKDALRLLQMGSITNSGGYFLRAGTDLTDAETLILTVVLKQVSDPNTESAESASLPKAANALALVPDTVADTIRFNGLEHVQVAPFVPPGVLAFGWTRTEPKTKTTDEDKFGYGTISLVEYSPKIQPATFFAVLTA
jgi:hypothetical protein